MSYQLKHSLNVSGNNGTQLISGLTKTDILIEITGNQTFSGGFLVERLTKRGRVFGARWLQDGIRGGLVPLEYGQRELLLDVPNPLMGFDLELVPDRYQFSYEVKIYERSPNPRFNDISEKLGIPLGLLKSIPQQTLLILEGISIMAGSDTRKLQADLQSISTAATTAASSAAAAQAAADAAQTTASSARSAVTTVEGDLVSAKAEMVQSREFELVQASFVLGSNEFGPCYLATVTHDLLGGTVQMSLLDADGDAQGYSQLIANKPGQPDKAMVELSMSQYSENSFPLNFVLQGQIGASVIPTPMIGYAVPNSSYRVRLNSSIQRLERSADNFVTVERVRDDQNIIAAKLSVDGRIDVILGDGTTYLWTEVGGSAWQGSSAPYYDSLTAANGAIVL